MTYSAEVKKPSNKKEGLMNFVQMIINDAEAGDAREAMYKAVDLLNDLRSGIYDCAIGGDEIKKAQNDKIVTSNLIENMKKESIKAENDAYAKGFDDGMAVVRKKMSEALGLVCHTSC